MVSRRRIYDVAFPLLGLNASGGVRMLLHVANELAARGLSVVISAPKPAALPSLAIRDDVTLSLRDARGGLGDRASFVQQIPDARVYVATGYQTPLLIRSSARGRRAPMVHIIQGDEAMSHVDFGARPALLKPALRAWARAGYRVPATRIAVSHFVAERVGKTRVQRVIAPGIESQFIDIAARNDDSIRSARTRGVIVGALAHPAPAKGMMDAIEAFQRAAPIGADHINFVLFDGRYQIDKVPIPVFSKIATGAGVAHEIASFYEYIDVFVFPSWVEGFGLPPLEAMACGAAVIVTDCGGVHEYARDGENCLIVTPRDVNAMAHAIEQLSLAPGAAELRARLARTGRATALEYPVERFVRACADEIERVLSR